MSARAFFLFNEINDINADSGSGVDGTVSIDTPEVSSIREATQLPENIKPDSVVSQACSSITGTVSTLTVKGKGGVPPLAIEPLNGDNILSVTESSVEKDDTEDKSTKPVSIDDIVPAQGVIVREDGSFILTPYPTSQITSRLPQEIECKNESNEVVSDRQPQQN